MFIFQELQVSSERYLKVTHEGNTYNLLDIPPESHTLVVEELERMKWLELDHLDEHFSLLVLLVEIAYFGAKLYPRLQAYGSKCLNSVVYLCHKTKNTLNIFVKNSETAVDKLNVAYQHLKENEEETALDWFTELSEMSNKMKIELQLLLGKCREQSKIIQGVYDEVLCEFKHTNEGEVKDLPDGSQQIMKQIAPSKMDTGSDYCLQQIQADKNIMHKILFLKQGHLSKKDKASIQEAKNVAIYFLDNIRVRMISVESHWEKIEQLFKSMDDSSINRQFTKRTLKEYKKDWQSNAFKENSLHFYAKWIALRKIFATAEEHVNSKIKDINVYIQVSFSEDKAIDHIKQAQGKLYKELRKLDYDINNM